jgi:hypothetical protein
MEATTLTEELTAMGFGKRIDEFKKFINYGGDKTSRSYWGCGHGSCHILDVREFSDKIVILTENHQWDNGTGIGMSTQVFVIDNGALFIGKEDVFRNQVSSHKDKPRRYFQKINNLTSTEGHEVTLQNPDAGYMDTIHLTQSV